MLNYIYKQKHNSKSFNRDHRWGDMRFIRGVPTHLIKECLPANSG